MHNVHVRHSLCGIGLMRFHRCCITECHTDTYTHTLLGSVQATCSCRWVLDVETPQPGDWGDGCIPGRCKCSAGPNGGSASTCQSPVCKPHAQSKQHTTCCIPARSPTCTTRPLTHSPIRPYFHLRPASAGPGRAHSLRCFGPASAPLHPMSPPDWPPPYTTSARPPRAATHTTATPFSP